MMLIDSWKRGGRGAVLAIVAVLVAACGGSDSDGSNPDSGTGDGGDGGSDVQRIWECQAAGDDIEYLNEVGCLSDFEALAALPMDSSLPGARSVKTVIDRVYDYRIYFQNTEKYKLHYEFANAQFSGIDASGGVTDPDAFNANYESVQRRFILGAVTYYEGPAKWVYEISPYDNADAEMVSDAMRIISESAFFGDELYFHPVGDGPEAVAEQLPDDLNVVTTQELYDGIDYQALNLARTCGRLVFMTAEALETEYVGYRDIVVLDTVPNDISVVQGIITAEFQTPLSHVNVLSQNRGTPNMGLRHAFENEALRALEGKWVVLDVGAFEYTIEETTEAIADTCWVQPTPIEMHPPNLEVTDLRNIEELYDPDSELTIKEQVSAAIPAFGGKASHFGALAHVPEANSPKAFGIPIYYYDLFMRENGFDQRVAAFLEEDNTLFKNDPAERDRVLAELREDMMAAPINADFMAELEEKLRTDFPNTRMRFRSSTNAEDLGDFTGAGLYTSFSAELDDPERLIETALRTVWSSIWYFRAFEEREYRGIDHRLVGMALLVHRSFPDEEANGVALTANPFDVSGAEPGFYVNVQVGDWSVVQPPAGITTDQFIYRLDKNTVRYIDHSNLVVSGTTVLTSGQIHELGVALDAIHTFFYPAYGPALGSDEWYAMDTEFKFDGEPGEEPILYVKQARPHPGR